ncbi:hypothetical protein CRM22_008404 [Opisthorchis felineus]|uniref:Uncharacterized protein n=1 Tax=Opisthorchis felineus TaxID=147828 RepID=A0A4S2LBV4_OPIFE|nr:hypothetical protein CRM22_008404 [Opisthorchis felineus]
MHVSCETGGTLLMCRKLLLVLSMSSTVLAAPVKHAAGTYASIFEPKLTQPGNGNMLAGPNDIQENLKNGKESGEKEKTISKPVRSSWSLDVGVLLENGRTTHYPNAAHTNTIDRDIHLKLFGEESGKLKKNQQIGVTKSVTTLMSPGHQKTTTSSMGLTANILRDLTGNQPTSMIPITAVQPYSATHKWKTTADNIATNTIPKLTTSPIKTRNLVAISSTTESGTSDESSFKPFAHSRTPFMDAKSHPLVSVNRRFQKISPDVDLVTSTTLRSRKGKKQRNLKKAEWDKTVQTSGGAKTSLRTKREDTKQDKKVFFKPFTGNPTLSVTKKGELNSLPIPWGVDSDTTLKVSKEIVPQEYDYDVEVDRDAKWLEASQTAEKDENDCTYCSDRTKRMRASENFTARTAIFQTDAPQLQATIRQPENSVSSQVIATKLSKDSSEKGYNLRDSDQKSGAEKPVNKISNFTKRRRHNDTVGEKPATNNPEKCDPNKPKLENLQKCQHKCSSCEEIEIQKVELTRKRVFYRKILRSFASKMKQN